jgi:hypothetical protein
MWLRRNVRQVCRRFGSGVFTMYFATVDSATSWSSNASSSRIRGAPQSGFSFDMRRMSAMTSASSFGRPGFARDFQRQ